MIEQHSKPWMAYTYNRLYRKGGDIGKAAQDLNVRLQDVWLYWHFSTNSFCLSTMLAMVIYQASAA